MADVRMIVKCDITHVGYVIPGGVDNREDAFVGWAFDGRNRSGTVGLHYNSDGTWLLGGYTADELREIAATEGTTC